MSMEQAILEHASALKELAAAIRSMGTSVSVGTTPALAFAADLNEAMKKDQTTTPGRDAAANKRAAEADKTLDVVAAVSAEIEAKGTVKPDADTAELPAGHVEHPSGVSVPLDYAKDVRPVLLAAIKKAGKETVAAMLETFGVTKADQLKAEQLPAVLTEAQKLAA